MSKFDFLKEMFFERTEKSGRNYRIYCCIGNAAENTILNIILEKYFGFFWTFFGHFQFWLFWLGSISLLSRAKKFKGFLLHLCRYGHFWSVKTCRYLADLDIFTPFLIYTFSHLKRPFIFFCFILFHFSKILFFNSFASFVK